MTKDEIIEKLRDDEHYYGKFGEQFLSNSNIKVLMENPSSLRTNTIESSPALVIGGYLHTAILEPHKLKKYKIVESSSRNTKKYKEISEGEMCLLQHEVDKIELMQDAILSNDVCNGLIHPPFGDVEYEVPGITELFGNMWKGKADVLNHADKLIVDIKTTRDINTFRRSAYKYNYDSQAYIYRTIFGYEMMFLVVCKTSHQIGLFDCSDAFYQSGERKVEEASAVYDLWYKDENFEKQQYLLTSTL